MKSSVPVLIAAVLISVFPSPSLARAQVDSAQAESEMDEEYKKLSGALQKKYAQMMRKGFEQQLEQYSQSYNEELADLQKLLPMEIEQLKIELGQLRERYGYQHPLVLKAQSKLGHYVAWMKKTLKLEEQKASNEAKIYYEQALNKKILDTKQQLAHHQQRYGNDHPKVASIVRQLQEWEKMQKSISSAEEDIAATILNDSSMRQLKKLLEMTRALRDQTYKLKTHPELIRELQLKLQAFEDAVAKSIASQTLALQKLRGRDGDLDSYAAQAQMSAAMQVAMADSVKAAEARAALAAKNARQAQEAQQAKLLQDLKAALQKTQSQQKPSANLDARLSAVESELKEIRQLLEKILDK